MWLVGDRPDMGRRLARYLVASYAYYILDESVGMTDCEYDALARELLANWYSFEHPHKYLIDTGDLSAGTAHEISEERYPGMVKGCARLLVERVRQGGRGL